MKSATSLAVLACITLGSILCAINVLNSLPRKTERRLWRIAAAMRAYEERFGRYPAAVTIDEVARAVDEPGKPGIPLRDGWLRRFQAQSQPHSYTIWSNGSDGRRDPAWVGAVRDGPRTLDIVLRDGQLAQHHWGALCGWSEIPSVARLPNLPDARNPGALVVELSRSVPSDCYPPPALQMCRDGVVLAELQNVPPVRFVGEAHTYDLRLKTGSGQVATWGPIEILPGAVTHREVEV